MILMSAWIVISIEEIARLEGLVSPESLFPDSFFHELVCQEFFSAFLVVDIISGYALMLLKKFVKRDKISAQTVNGITLALKLV